MPWDSSRPVPWRRLLVFEAIYLGLFVGFVVITRPDETSSAISSIVLAGAITTAVLVALIKFGYQPNWLRSREEQAAIRAQKIAQRDEQRAARRGAPAPGAQRYRPPPTKRTSTGHTNRPRRTRHTRKR
jgi:hypothetical protein